MLQYPPLYNDRRRSLYDLCIVSLRHNHLTSSILPHLHEFLVHHLTLCVIPGDQCIQYGEKRRKPGEHKQQVTQITRDYPAPRSYDYFTHWPYVLALTHLNNFFSSLTSLILLTLFLTAQDSSILRRICILIKYLYL